MKRDGGGVLLKECMSVAGVGNLLFIIGNMGQHGYLNILKNNLEESAHKLGFTWSLIFQQDNEPYSPTRQRMAHI